MPLFRPATARPLVVCLTLLAGCATHPASPARTTTDRPPNVVIIFTDDQGYGDVGVFGARDLATPNLDRMAHQGMTLRSFYVAQAVCSASRAALLTGSYPNRVSIEYALAPWHLHGLHPDEKTIAEVVKERGYRTAMFGKWHLGRPEILLPTRQGFDEYFGLPYSNDMWPRHPVPEIAAKWPDLPLIAGDQVIELNPDQTKLTSAYTQKAVDFIARNKGHPFFLYLPHAMPHVPLFVGENHTGHSRRGLYGDVIEEIDWSVGQILKALETHGIAENTLVIFTSDNGPWHLYGEHAGSAAPLRGGKMTTFEGGVRVPAIVWWPGHVPAGATTDEMVLSMDILPTIARLVGGQVPADRPIDGKDVWPLLSGQPDATTPHEAFFYYWGPELQAVRSGPWKLHFAHEYKAITQPGEGGLPGKQTMKALPLSLYNLDEDVGETRNLAMEHPDIVARLSNLAEQARVELGDSLTGRTGNAIRPAGQAQP